MDTSLLKGVLRGRAEARRDFVRRYAPLVHAWVLARVGTGPEVDELTRQVLRRFLLECRRRCADAAAPRALQDLVQDVVGAQLLALGKGGVPTGELDPVLFPWRVSVHPRAQEAARRLGAEEVSRASRCLQQLALAHREALLIHHGEGLSPKDRSAATGEPEQAALDLLLEAQEAFGERLAVARALDAEADRA